MNQKIPKTQMQVPFRYLLLAIALLALALLGIAVMLKELHEAEVLLGQAGKSEYVNTGYDLMIEFVKTIFIGVAIGIGVEAYLKYLEIVHSQKETLAKSGIVDLYTSREDASDRFISLATDTRTKNIAICGISLRDFLHGQTGPSHSVWLAIKTRLEAEEKNKLPSQQRLRLRLLMVDPGSPEGHFRYLIEEPGSPGKPIDIDKSLREISKTLNIYENSEQDFLRVKLYGHCPFSFVFLTDTTVFVEQYYYKAQVTEASIPLIEYAGNSDQYSIFSESVNTIWNHATTEQTEIGTAIPIREARINNIYLKSNRAKQGEHQVKRIQTNRAETIDILSITGGYYVEDFDASTELRAFAVKTNEKGGTVRFALLNPISQQAIFRAVADECRTNEIGEALTKYDWRTHRNSRLYFRLRNTINLINKWSNDHRIELHLYSCATSCALLLTSESAFVGHYLYGRSKKLQKENKLHSEYPMLEFARSQSESGTDHQLDILRSTFQIVWDHYSIPYEKYKEADKERAFNNNLTRLKEELGISTS